MSDLISRQAAIDALDGEIEITGRTNAEAVKGYVRLVKDRLERLPSAQPEINCSEIPNGSDDTISRQMALDALDEQIEQCNKALGSFDISPKDEYAIKVERASLEAYKEQLENMPSAQPERKKGRWVYNSPVTMKCNQCGLVIKDWDWHRFKFCPNCGADMRGEQDE